MSGRWGERRDGEVRGEQQSSPDECVSRELIKKLADLGMAMSFRRSYITGTTLLSERTGTHSSQPDDVPYR